MEIFSVPQYGPPPLGNIYPTERKEAVRRDTTWANSENIVKGIQTPSEMCTQVNL